MIRLEMGALAAWTPAQHSKIIPYAVEEYPILFSHAASSILTVAPERTFWEKATILHHEANRPLDSPMPARYARHYYDLYQMLNSPVKTIAMNHMDLLHHVVAFKAKFYPRTWAKYQEAKPGTIRLVPPEIRMAALETDYSAMGDMIFGSKPSFEDILTVIQRFEDDINRLV